MAEIPTSTAAMPGRNLTAADLARGHAHRRSPQIRACGNCGQGGTPRRLSTNRYCCASCGQVFPYTERDGMPMRVWMSLADNEDSEGRVPKDQGWNPA